jgi:hypothetical protein
VPLLTAVAVQDHVLDESGWKQVHGDVFRPPTQLSLFSALIGTGHQLVFLVFASVLLAIAGRHYMGYVHTARHAPSLTRAPAADVC